MITVSRFLYILISLDIISTNKRINQHDARQKEDNHNMSSVQLFDNSKRINTFTSDDNINGQSSISEEANSSNFFMTSQSNASKGNANKKIYKYFEKKQYEKEFSNMTKAYAKKRKAKRKKVTNFNINYEEMKDYSRINRNNRIRRKVNTGLKHDDLEGKLFQF